MRSHQPSAVSRTAWASGIWPSASGPTLSSRLPPRAAMSTTIQISSSTVGIVASDSIRLYANDRPMPRHTSHLRSASASTLYSGVRKSACSVPLMTANMFHRSFTTPSGTAA
jgi:hypothetical protein